MNCQDVKNKLSEMDKKIADRNAKTQEYFELIKDDAVEYLIDQHVKNEFCGISERLSQNFIIDLLLEKLGAELKHKEMGLPLYMGEWDLLILYPPSMIMIDYLAGKINDSKEKEDLISESKRDREIIINFRESFNFYDFYKLINSHLESIGFETIDYHRGMYSITRSQLENQCCDKKQDISFKIDNPEIVTSKVEVEVVESDVNYQAIGGIVVALILIVACLFMYLGSA